jgi:flagellar basal body L-ring protein FlgH
LAEGKPLPVQNLLSVSGCTGQHALWQALNAALSARPAGAIEHEAAAAGALEQTARGLRGQIAVRLGLAAIAGRDWNAASRLHAMASRDEEVTLRLAATVESVLPNGHLVIRGSQEVRINFELRDLQVSGIVRPEDISRQNVITYDKIADARIVYGGRGQITDMQQPRLGQQIVDLLSPF